MPKMAPGKMPENRPRCVLLGGGGHARVLIDCIRESGDAISYAILDANADLWGTKVLGVLVMGGDEKLPELLAQGIKVFAVGVGNVGDANPRRRLFELGISRGLTPITVRHPTAVCSTAAEIGPGCQLLPGCIVNAGAVVGANVIINSGAIVEHDCTVGDHVHVATGARLASTIRVGNGALIGAGAIIKQYITVGEGAVVGAGAVVVKDVPPGVTVAGVPGRPL